jgi:hypothetical protein
MDDDLPKEGELLDISKNKPMGQHQDSGLLTEVKPPAKIPVGLIVIAILIAAVLLVSRSSFGVHEDPVKVAQYKENSKIIFDTMKSQVPFLVSVACEGSDPNKPDCVSFIGTFRPNKDSPNYQSLMDTNDKVYGASVNDIAAIKEQLKLLVDLKRMTLRTVRLPLTFVIDSIDIPRVGDDIPVRIRCTENTAETIVCLSER